MVLITVLKQDAERQNKNGYVLVHESEVLAIAVVLSIECCIATLFLTLGARQIVWRSYCT